MEVDEVPAELLDGPGGLPLPVISEGAAPILLTEDVILEVALAFAKPVSQSTDNIRICE